MGPSALFRHPAQLQISDLNIGRERCGCLPPPPPHDAPLRSISTTPDCLRHRRRSRLAPGLQISTVEGDTVVRHAWTTRHRTRVGDALSTDLTRFKLYELEAAARVRPTSSFVWPTAPCLRMPKIPCRPPTRRRIGSRRPPVHAVDGEGTRCSVRGASPRISSNAPEHAPVNSAVGMFHQPSKHLPKRRGRYMGEASAAGGYSVPIALRRKSSEGRSAPCRCRGRDADRVRGSGSPRSPQMADAMRKNGVESPDGRHVQTSPHHEARSRHSDWGDPDAALDRPRQSDARLSNWTTKQRDDDLTEPNGKDRPTAIWEQDTASSHVGGGIDIGCRQHSCRPLTLKRQARRCGAVFVWSTGR